MNISIITLSVSFILMLIGILGIITQKNIIKIIIGFTIFDTGLNIAIVSIGYVRDKTAPIIDNAVGLNNIAGKIVDPVPQALVLTSIVIGLGVTALMLVYALKLYEKKGTLDITKYKDLKW